MKKILLLLLTTILPVMASAYDAFIDGIYYNYDKTDNTAEVTGGGDNYYFGYDIDEGGSYKIYVNSYSGVVNIPLSVDYDGITYDVTRIGYNAFNECNSLTSITIPNSITSIGNYAFYRCSSLTSLTIPNSVESIGFGAFMNCSGLTSVTIPNSVTSIEDHTFFGCSGLTSLTIPNNLSSIGNFAFYKCSGLSSITIPNCVTSIGDASFYGCTGLTSVKMSEQMICIGDSAFQNCNSLETITIPNSVEEIGNFAFRDCNNLTSVTIGSGLKNMRGHAFYGCTNLTTVTINCEYVGEWFSGMESISDLIFGDEVKSIGIGSIMWIGCFQGCSGLTSVKIGNNLTNIGNDAFSGCSSLTSISIPGSVTSIGYDAFSGCTALMNVKSYIKEPFNISKFSEETYRNGTLYVPAGTKDLYIRFDGWREFLKIEEMEEEPAPNGQCETPTIIVMGNKFKFQCETPGAEFTSTLTSEEQFTGDEVVMNNDEITYILTVYATAPGYDQSNPAKYRFTVNKSDVNRDGKVDVADITTIINAMASKSRK